MEHRRPPLTGWRIDLVRSALVDVICQSREGERWHVSRGDHERSYIIGYIHDCIVFRAITHISYTGGRSTHRPLRGYVVLVSHSADRTAQGGTVQAPGRAADHWRPGRPAARPAPSPQQNQQNLSIILLGKLMRRESSTDSLSDPPMVIYINTWKYTWISYLNNINL